MRSHTTPRSRYPEKLQLRLSTKLMARLESAATLANTEEAPVTPSDLVRLALDRYLPPLPLEGASEAPTQIAPGLFGTPDEDLP
jgi:hypothetical protein